MDRSVNHNVTVAMLLLKTNPKRLNFNIIPELFCTQKSMGEQVSILTITLKSILFYVLIFLFKEN